MIDNSDSVGEVETKFFSLSTKDSEPYQLRRGGLLPEAVLAYETYGTLSPNKDNAILVFHALTGSQHMAGINKSVPSVEKLWTKDMWTGWWDNFVGPNKVIDTNKFYVVCANYLGGCYGSTGSMSINPETGKPYGGSFPWLTVSDSVDSQIKLLDALGIKKLHCVIGPSMGGMFALDLATRYPDRVEVVIPVATSAEISPLNRIYNFEQICAIEFDPAFNNGDYYGTEGPRKGMTLARMICHKLFIDVDKLDDRVKGKLTGNDEFGQYKLTNKIESYLLHQGHKFEERFDANTYLCILGMLQSFDILAEAGCNNYKELFSVCAENKQRYLVFGIDTDSFFTVPEQQKLVNDLQSAGVETKFVVVSSNKGHDSFLLESDLYLQHFKEMLE